MPPRNRQSGKRASGPPSKTSVSLDDVLPTARESTEPWIPSARPSTSEPLRMLTRTSRSRAQPSQSTNTPKIWEKEKEIEVRGQSKASQTGVLDDDSPGDSPRSWSQIRTLEITASRPDPSSSPATRASRWERTTSFTPHRIFPTEEDTLDPFLVPRRPSSRQPAYSTSSSSLQLQHIFTHLEEEGPPPRAAAGGSRRATPLRSSKRPRETDADEQRRPFNAGGRGAVWPGEPSPHSEARLGSRHLVFEEENEQDVLDGMRRTTTELSRISQQEDRYTAEPTSISALYTPRPSGATLPPLLSTGIRYSSVFSQRRSGSSSSTEVGVEQKDASSQEHAEESPRREDRRSSHRHTGSYVLQHHLPDAVLAPLTIQIGVMPLPGSEASNAGLQTSVHTLPAREFFQLPLACPLDAMAAIDDPSSAGEVSDGSRAARGGSNLQSPVPVTEYADIVGWSAVLPEVSLHTEEASLSWWSSFVTLHNESLSAANAIRSSAPPAAAGTPLRATASVTAILSPFT